MLNTAESYSGALHQAVALGDRAFTYPQHSATCHGNPGCFRHMPRCSAKPLQLVPLGANFIIGWLGALRCSLRLSEWHVTIYNTKDAGGRKSPQHLRSLNNLLNFWRIMIAYGRLSSTSKGHSENQAGSEIWNKIFLGESMITKENDLSISLSWQTIPVILHRTCLVRRRCCTSREGILRSHTLLLC